MARRSSFSLSVGQLVGASFRNFFRNLVPFSILGALILSPWIAFHVWQVNQFTVIETSTGPVTFPNVALLVVDFLLQTLLGYVLTGAVTYGVVQQLSGQPAPLAATISKGLQVFGRTLATGFLAGLRILLFTLLLVVPGIIEAIKLYVAIPVAVIEGGGAGRAIERSKALTDGCRWQVFGSWVVVILIGWGVLFLIGAVFAMLAPEQARTNAGLFFGLQIATTVLLTTFSATVAAVCYSMLRRGKENVDAQQLASVFA